MPTQSQAPPLGPPLYTSAISRLTSDLKMDELSYKPIVFLMTIQNIFNEIYLEIEVLAPEGRNEADEGQSLKICHIDI